MRIRLKQTKKKNATHFLSSSVNVMSRVLSSSVSSAVWTLRIATPLACHVALLRSLRCRFFWVIARVLKKVWTYPLGRPVQRLIFLKKTRSFFEALRFWVHVFGAFIQSLQSRRKWCSFCTNLSQKSIVFTSAHTHTHTHTQTHKRNNKVKCIATRLNSESTSRNSQRR